MLIDACVLATCCVVARQYSAVLRMLQMRHSSSIVNLAASDPSFSFSKLLMVRPPLLVLVLHANKHKHGYQRTRTQPSSPPRWKKQNKDCMETTRQLLKNKDPFWNSQRQYGVNHTRRRVGIFLLLKSGKKPHKYDHTETSTRSPLKHHRSINTPNKSLSNWEDQNSTITREDQIKSNVRKSGGSTHLGRFPERIFQAYSRRYFWKMVLRAIMGSPVLSCEHCTIHFL